MLNTALALTLVAAVAVLARTWQLSQNDFGRQYYAAGVLSCLGSWHISSSRVQPRRLCFPRQSRLWRSLAAGRSAKPLGFGALSILLVR